MVKISKKELKGLIGKILEARLQKEESAEGAVDETTEEATDIALEETAEDSADEVIEETSEEINEEAPCPQCGEVVCKCPVEENTDSIQTPEQEQSLYESRFGKRNEELFSKLKKLWTK